MLKQLLRRLLLFNVVWSTIRLLIFQMEIFPQVFNSANIVYESGLLVHLDVPYLCGSVRVWSG